MTTTLLRPRAQADLVERTDYYRTEIGTDVATRFFDAAAEALRAIGRMPRAGSPRVGEIAEIPGLRAWRVEGFPCFWCYFVLDDRVDVVRLLADRQDVVSILAEASPE